MVNYTETRKDDFLKTISDIENILDENYFHIHTNYGKKEWKIYYKNLKAEDYYSENNKPLLTSKNNDLNDVRKLKLRFEKEKDKAIKKNKMLYHELQINYHINMNELQMKYIHGRNILNYFIALLAIINIFTVREAFTAICLLLTMLFNITICGVKLDKKVDEKIEKDMEVFKNKYTKEYLKIFRLNFVERLRLYGTNKKTRKKANKII